MGTRTQPDGHRAAGRAIARSFLDATNITAVILGLVPWIRRIR
jgi:hypothetical protein